MSIPTGGDGRRPTPRAQTLIVLAVSIFLFVLIGGILLLPDLLAGGTPQDLGLTLGITAVILGISTVIALVQWRRDPSWDELPPVLGMDRAERRAAARALRPGGSVDPAYAASTRKVADHVVRRRAEFWSALGTALLLGNLAMSKAGSWRWALVAMAVLCVLGGIWGLVRLRKARAILGDDRGGGCAPPTAAKS